MLVAMLIYNILHLQAENRKYRNERARLIDERNENFTRLRKLYSQEDQIKKDIATTRDEMYKNRKCKHGAAMIILFGHYLNIS